MNKYLKTKQDEIGYLKVLFRQMNADGEITLREIGFTRAMMKALDISPSTYEEADRLFKGGDRTIPEFSSKQAAMQAIMDSIGLSMTDLDFSQSEVEEIIKLAEEIGIEENKEAAAAINEYVEKYLSTNAEFSASLAKIIADKELSSLDGVFADVKDQKNFVKAMSRVAFADGNRSFDEQMMGKMIGGGVFNINMEVAFSAMEEYKADPDARIEISSDKAKRVTINSIIRMACADGVFSDAEKAEVKNIIAEIGAEVSEALIEEIAEKAKKRSEATALKEKALSIWVG